MSDDTGATEKKRTLNIPWQTVAASVTRDERTDALGRNAWALPEFPPGVAPKAGMAQDRACNGVLDFGLQYGLMGDDSFFLGYPVLAQLAQRPEYRRAVETIARHMTRKWIKITAIGDEDKSAKIDKLNELMDTLNVERHFRVAAEHDGFFGRAHIFVDFNRVRDPLELRVPVGDGKNDLSRLKVKKGDKIELRNVEPSWCYPNRYSSSDPLEPSWYNPTEWIVNTRTLHATRLLTLIGRPVPDILKPAYAFGGLPLTQLMRPYVDNWIRARQSVSDIMAAFSTFVLKTNLVEQTSIDGDALVRRLQLFNNLRDNRGVMAVDKELEDFMNVSAPLSTLDKLQAQAQEQMAAVTGIPLVELLGITPSGLNASSEGEIQTFFDWVHSSQETLFRPPLEAVFGFLQLTEFGDVDPTLMFEFEPLWGMDDLEIANMRKAEIDADVALVEAGIISVEEARKRIAEDDESPYAGIDPSDIPEPPMGEGGMGEGGLPGMPVPGAGGEGDATPGMSPAGGQASPSSPVDILAEALGVAAPAPEEDAGASPVEVLATALGVGEGAPETDAGTNPLDVLRRALVGDADIPPGAKWITIKSGAHVLISKTGEILAGLGGSHNGKNISDLGDEGGENKSGKNTTQLKDIIYAAVYKKTPSGKDVTKALSAIHELQSMGAWKLTPAMKEKIAQLHAAALSEEQKSALEHAHGGKLGAPPPPAPAAAPKSETKAAEGQWSKLQAAMGSNPGGIYKDPNGVKHYVKFYANPEQAKTEELAGKIGAAMGVHTMEPKVKTVDGKPALTTEYMEGVKPFNMSSLAGMTPKQKDQLAAIFAHAIVTKNWDVVGTAFDNIVEDKMGNLRVVDMGGSFKFRAQGGPKEYTGDIHEDMKNMLTSDKYPAGKLFKKFFTDNPNQWATVSQWAVPSNLVHDLAGDMKSAMVERGKTLKAVADGFHDLFKKGKAPTALTPATPAAAPAAKPAAKPSANIATMSHTSPQVHQHAQEYLIKEKGHSPEEAKDLAHAAVAYSTALGASSGSVKDALNSVSGSMNALKSLIAQHDLKMTPGQLFLLRSYTGGGYRKLNEALRNNKLSAAQWDFTSGITKALKTLPNFEGKVMRGTSKFDEFDKMEPGEVYHQSGFLSTASKGKGFSGEYKLTIISKTGKAVDHLSHHMGEHEVLFRQNTPFRVVAKDPLKKTMTLEEMDRED